MLLLNRSSGFITDSDLLFIRSDFVTVALLLPKRSSGFITDSNLLFIRSDFVTGVRICNNKTLTWLIIDRRQHITYKNSMIVFELSPSFYLLYKPFSSKNRSQSNSGNSIVIRRVPSIE